MTSTEIYNQPPTVADTLTSITNLRENIQTLKEKLFQANSDFLEYKSKVEKVLLEEADEDSASTISSIAEKLGIELTKEVSASVTVVLHIDGNVPFYMTKDQVQEFLSHNLDITVGSYDGNLDGWVDNIEDVYNVKIS